MSDPIYLRGGYQRGMFGLFRGAASVLWGAGRIMRDGKLRTLATVPVVLTGFLYLIVMGSTFYFAPMVVQKVFDGQAWDRAGWMGGIAYWVVLVLAVVSLMVLLILLFSTLVEAVGGPFYDKLAIRVLDGHGISHQEPGFIEGMVPDLIRSLAFLFGVIVFALLGYIPIIGLPFFVVSAGLAWLGLAASAVNPALLVTGHKLGDRIRFVFRHFSTSLGIGAVIGLSLLVPLLGLLAIPSAIVGASELYARTEGDA